MSKFKKPQLTESSGNVGLAKGLSFSDIGIDYPIFCFKHLHSDYNVDTCLLQDRRFLEQFALRLVLLGGLSWDQIRLAGRTGVGSEKIARGSIIPSIPTSITEDVQDFLSFRFAGADARIIGFRNTSVLHIVYIDTSLSVYRH